VRFLRVLLFNDHGRGGGAERYVDTVADALKAKRIETVKLCRVRGGNGWIELGGVPEVRLSDYIKGNMSYQKLLDQVLFKFKPDIVHVNEVQLYYADLLVKLSRKYCSKLVLTTHNYGYLCPTALYIKIPEMEPCDKPYFNNHCLTCLLNTGSGFQSKLRNSSRVLYSMSKWSSFLSSFDTIISPSQLFAELLRDKITKNVHHLWNPIRRRFLEEQPETQDDTKKQVLFAGRLVESKGVKFLPLLARLLKNVSFLVAGSGPLRGYLIRNGTENIICCGLTDEEGIVRLLDKCDVTIVPSAVCEMSPTIITESLSRGKPVVAFDLGGQAELVKWSGGGFVAGPFDIYDFSEKVEKLIQGRELATKMGHRGRESIKRNSDPGHYAERLLNIYYYL